MSSISNLYPSLYISYLYIRLERSQITLVADISGGTNLYFTESFKRQILLCLEKRTKIQEHQSVLALNCYIRCFFIFLWASGKLITFSHPDPSSLQDCHQQYIPCQLAKLSLHTSVYLYFSFLMSNICHVIRWKWLVF